MLRETAQTPEEDLAALQDVGRHRYVNTNNLWVDLEALRATLRRARRRARAADHRQPQDGRPVGLRLARPVIQLETAMGAAIGVFEGARALHVPRRRFAPVKTTNDLLALRSDAYVLRDDRRVELAPEREEPPVIDLDPDYYKLVGDFEPRFPAGPPSLVGVRAPHRRPAT